jgi:hypothetical protein
VIAASDQLTPGNPGASKILLFPMGGGAPRQLTTALGTGYQEFAFLKPDHTGYLVTSDYKGWINGIDRWLVSASSPASAPVRVTRFADYTTGHPQAGISGGMAFVSNKQAAVGYGQGGAQDAYLVAVP